MKGILIRSAAVLALCTAPGMAWAQTETPAPKPPVQSQGGQAASPDGTAAGETAPSGSGSNAPAESGSGSSGSSQSGSQSGSQDGSSTTGGTAGSQGSSSTTGGTGEQGGGASSGQGSTEGGSTATKPAENETTGQKSSSGGGVQVNVTSEQQTEIRQIITETKVEPVPSVDFTVNVGAAVPQTVTLHPLPPRIIKLVPEYESYEYFVLADGRIVIVDPGSHEIVLIIS